MTYPVANQWWDASLIAIGIGSIDSTSFPSFSIIPQKQIHTVILTQIYINFAKTGCRLSHKPRFPVSYKPKRTIERFLVSRNTKPKRFKGSR